MKREACTAGAAAGFASTHTLSKTRNHNDNSLKLSLEAAPAGGSVLLHCDAPVISGGEVHSIGSLISEVLPSARRMVVDLSGVLAIDTSALGELVLMQMWADAAGYTLTFASPSKSVSGLLENTNLVSVLDLYSSVDAAIAALHQEGVQSA